MTNIIQITATFAPTARGNGTHIVYGLGINNKLYKWNFSSQSWDVT
jgi:hypothetical protein